MPRQQLGERQRRVSGRGKEGEAVRRSRRTRRTHPLHPRPKIFVGPAEGSLRPFRVLTGPALRARGGTLLRVFRVNLLPSKRSQAAVVVGVALASAQSAASAL